METRRGETEDDQHYANIIKTVFVYRFLVSKKDVFIADFLAIFSESHKVIFFDDFVRLFSASGGLGVSKGFGKDIKEIHTLTMLLLP